MKYRIILLISIILISISCDSDNPDLVPNDPPSSSKNLIQLSAQVDFEGRSIKTNAVLDRNTGTIFFPVGADLSSIKIEFGISQKAKLFLQGEEMLSGSSRVDFNNRLNFEVVAEDGSKREYEITSISKFEEMEAALLAFMEDFNVPGLQFAIIRNEKLVYQGSLGLSDVENNTKVKNNSLFRIASISKPITSIAIYNLAQKGELSLNMTVFGDNGVLGKRYGDGEYPDNIKLIQVRHLLDHTSGFTNNPYDIMFDDPSLTQDQLISEVLDNRGLSSSPGTTYYYSNFGYSLLGRIIEEVSGKNYERYVLDEVLGPAGISDMRIGGNLLEEKFENEVVYYEQEGFSPYSMNVTRMDSHGGWIASASDLARFLVTIDRGIGVPDIVGTPFIEREYFGYENWWFSGSLPGTSTVISRMDNNFSFVILTNTRTIPIESILQQMEKIMRLQIQARSIWPSYDLF